MKYQNPYKFDVWSFLMFLFGGFLSMFQRKCPICNNNNWSVGWLKNGSNKYQCLDCKRWWLR